MKGNPIAENRFRAQSWSIETDEPCESEWFQTKEQAIRYSKATLLDDYRKAGNKSLIVMKIFNEMNYKQQPTIVTYKDAI